MGCFVVKEKLKRVKEKHKVWNRSSYENLYKRIKLMEDLLLMFDLELEGRWDEVHSLNARSKVVDHTPPRIIKESLGSQKLFHGGEQNVVVDDEAGHGLEQGTPSIFHWTHFNAAEPCGGYAGPCEAREHIGNPDSNNLFGQWHCS